MDFFNFMQPLALLACAVAGYVIIFRERKQRRNNGHYTLPDWNFFIKKWWAEREVRRIKSDLIKNDKDLKDYTCEDPKALQNEYSADSQLFYGSDMDGNSLLLKITRRRHRTAEVWLVLRLKDGTVYTLPDHPDTRIENVTSRIFEAAGLKLECVVPYSRWRIRFSGLLRRGARHNWSPTTADDELDYVRFNFFWITSSNPIHWPYDWSNKLMAISLATEPWRDGRWMHQLSKPDSGGYDQFGSLLGQLFIETSEKDVSTDVPEVKMIDLNLPGLRQRRWGPNKITHLHRTGSIVGVCRDGSIYLIGALSSKEGLTHSQYGYIRLPNGDVYNIDWTDFHLSNLAEVPESIPNAMTLRFLANGKYFTTVIHFRTDSKVPLAGGRPFDWCANCIPCELGLNGGRGLGLAMLWYPYKVIYGQDLTPPEGPRIKRLVHSLEIPTRQELAISFSKQPAQSLSVAGGKGASLALLTTLADANHGDKVGELNVHELIDKMPKHNILINKLRRDRKISKSDWDISMPIESGHSETLKEILLNWKPQEELKCPDFIVPDGFVLSVTAFEIQLETNPHLVSVIRDVENIAHGIVDGDLEDVCKKAVKQIASTRINKEIKDAIAVAYEEMKRKFENDPKQSKRSSTSSGSENESFIVLHEENQLRVAVRSSAIGEDSEGASSAGQNETLLGLNNIDEVYDAVRLCWASLYAFQSVQYRKQHVQPIKNGMAVVIQAMVPAESAGVLFTRHPATGDPSKILITSNYGLGESVVSGNVEPDEIIIRRSYKDDKLKIIGIKLGRKDHSINMATGSNDNTIVHTLNETDRLKSSLSSDDALKLAEIGIVLEKMYGSARDIEWAIYKNEIYLLQARPVTTLDTYSDWELLHEYDLATMCADDLYTLANVGEVFPSVCTPITLSTITKVFDRSIALQAMNLDHTGLFPISIANSHYRVIMEVYNIFLSNNEEQITLSDVVMSFAIFGHNFITPEIHKVAKHRNGLLSGFNKLKKMISTAKSIWINGSTVKKYQEVVATLKSTYTEENLKKITTIEQTFNEFNKILQIFFKTSTYHNISGEVSVVFQLIALIVLTEGKMDWSNDIYADIALMLGSCKDVESADIPKKLKEISDIIKTKSDGKDFIVQSPQDGIKWLEKNCAEAFSLFQEFITKHKHRALREFDMATETWGMKPEIIIEMIQASVNCDTEQVQSKHLTENEIIEALKCPKKGSTRWILKKLLPYCTMSVQRRETTKSCMVSILYEMKMLLRYLAKQMMHQGMLPDENLIFYLTIEELKRVCKCPDASIVMKAHRRRKLFPTWNEFQFPELLKGVPCPLNAVHEDIGEDGVDAIRVRGTPVCAGTVTGRACVLKTFADVHKIQKGDILITRSTDIGWSPYFPILKGVVTELGGLISHGAVVAREYGLPCIVGAHGATDKLHFGDKITLYGARGVIVKHDE